MPRTSIERATNIHRHHYLRERDIHVCQYCGTAEHRNGKFWWAGRCSELEPPCGDDLVGQESWFEAAEREVE